MVAHSAVLLCFLAVSPASPPAADAALADAERAADAGRLPEAAAAYEWALSLAPRSAAALNGLGGVLFRQGKRDAAVNRFQAAIAADPAFARAYLSLGHAARKSGDDATAVKAYERYVALAPQDPDGYFGLAESARLLGRKDEALEAYETYLSLEHRPPAARWVERSRAFVAELHAQGAVSRERGADAAERIADGDRLAAAGSLEAATAAYEGALKRDPANLDALSRLASVEERRGDDGSAMAHWERVVALAPDGERRAEARARLSQARERHAGDAGATLARAREAYERGVEEVKRRDYAAAVRSLDAALAVDPDLAVAFTARGSAHLGQRMFYEAAADYQEALRLDPSRASPLYGLAEAYRAAGRKDDARSYYERYAQSLASDARPELQSQAREKASGLRASVSEGAR